MARKRGRPGRSERIFMQSGGPCGTGHRLRGGRTAEGGGSAFPLVRAEIRRVLSRTVERCLRRPSLPPADPCTILRRADIAESDVRLFRSGASVFVSIT